VLRRQPPGGPRSSGPAGALSIGLLAALAWVSQAGTKPLPCRRPMVLLWGQQHQVRQRWLTIEASERRFVGSAACHGAAERAWRPWRQSRSPALRQIASLDCPRAIAVAAAGGVDFSCDSGCGLGG
jgi:hypothetical protein